MFFSYRTRRVLARIFPTLLTVAVLALVALLCWMLWLQRFVVYTQQGAMFDFGLQPPTMEGVIPQRPPNGNVVIEYPEREPGPTQPPAVKPDDPDLPDEPLDPDLPVIPDDPVKPVQTAINGYYIDPKALQKDPEAVRAQLEQLPAGTAVLMQVRSFWGYRYFSSDFGKVSASYNIEKMDALIAWLAESDLHVIAKMPAFRDYYYSVDNVSCGLPVAGGYLWPDASGCYWLNPKNDKVLTRLTQMVRELKNLGFDEVLFTDFTMPESEKIIFEGDRKEAVYAAAETLVAACASDRFTVSFVTEDMAFRLPEGNCRLYIENAEPSALADILEQLQTEDDLVQIVFFCDNFDNRFDGYSVLRPLELAL